jgi:hypothetical protein
MTPLTIAGASLNASAIRVRPGTEAATQKVGRPETAYLIDFLAPSYACANAALALARR